MRSRCPRSTSIERHPSRSGGGCSTTRATAAAWARSNGPLGTRRPQSPLQSTRTVTLTSGTLYCHRPRTTHEPLMRLETSAVTSLCTREPSSCRSSRRGLRPTSSPPFGPPSTSASAPTRPSSPPPTSDACDPTSYVTERACRRRGLSAAQFRERRQQRGHFALERTQPCTRAHQRETSQLAVRNLLRHSRSPGHFTHQELRIGNESS